MESDQIVLADVPGVAGPFGFDRVDAPWPNQGVVDIAVSVEVEAVDTAPAGETVPSPAGSTRSSGLTESAQASIVRTRCEMNCGPFPDHANGDKYAEHESSPFSRSGDRVHGGADSRY